MNIPSESECLKLLDENNALVKNHSIFVKNIALKIASHLEKRGIEINKDLLTAGALLHDIKKKFFFADDHGKQGQEFLEKLGYPEVGRIVGTHLFESRPETWEEKIVYYADKICNPGNRLVSITERIEYAKRQYGLPEHKIEPWIKEASEVEKELLGDRCEDVKKRLL